MNFGETTFLPRRKTEVKSTTSVEFSVRNSDFSNGTEDFSERSLNSLIISLFRTKVSKTLLNSIELTNVTITGDSRFDRVIENREKAKDNEYHSTI